jgi:large subunit ribosomal protein L41
MKSTPSLQRAIRRLPLTTKQGPHNYYKGNRTGAMGRHTKWGGYIIDWKKVRTYVCPDLSGFQVSGMIWIVFGWRVADDRIVDSLRYEGIES